MATTSTTLAVAMRVSDLSAVLTSTTGTATGNTLLIGGEYMTQTGEAVGSIVPVRRGQNGSAQIAHALAAAVTMGLPSDFTIPPAVQGAVYTDTTLTGDGTSSNPLAAAASGNAGGTDGQVQYNNAGAFGGFGSWDGTNLVPVSGLRLSATPFDVGGRLLNQSSAYTVGADLPADYDYFMASFAVDTTGNANTVDTLAGHILRVTHAGSGAAYFVEGMEVYSQATGAGDVTGGLTGIYSHTGTQAGYSGTITATPASFWAWNQFADSANSLDTNVTGFYYQAPSIGATAMTAGHAAIGYWADALGGTATNAYSLWSDEQGVFRIKADNTFDSVYQAIPALYNPLFTKYTPGAVNYERIVQQWSTNVAQIGAEKGGTGTLRALQLIGASVATDGVFQAGGYKSSDGSAGVTAGPFTAITAITVKDGLVTSITGT